MTFAESSIGIEVSPVRTIIGPFKRLDLEQHKPSVMSGRAVKVTVLSTHPLFDTRVANHLRTLLDHGYEVTYINWSRDGELPKSLQSGGLHLVRRKANAAFGRNVFRFSWMLCWFTMACLRHRSSVVHFHDMLLLPIIAPLKLLTRSRVVFDVHEHYNRCQGLKGKYFRICYKLFLPAIDGLVGVVQSTLPRDDEASVIIPNYQRRSDFEHVASSTTRDGRLRVIYFGSMWTESREVGLMLTLAAHIMAEFSHVEFRLGGQLGGRDVSRCRQRLAELEQRFPEQFKWFGLTPRDEVIYQTAQADVGIFLLNADDLNNHGSGPNKIYEYLTVGAAIVATDCFSIADRIRDAGAGILVPPGVKPELLVGEVKDLLSNQKRLKAMKAASAALGHQYAWERVDVGYTELYRRLGVGCPKTALRTCRTGPTRLDYPLLGQTRK